MSTRTTKRRGTTFFASIVWTMCGVFLLGLMPQWNPVQAQNTPQKISTVNILLHSNYNSHEKAKVNLLRSVVQHAQKNKWNLYYLEGNRYKPCKVSSSLSSTVPISPENKCVKFTKNYQSPGEAELQVVRMRNDTKKHIITKFKFTSSRLNGRNQSIKIRTQINFLDKNNASVVVPGVITGKNDNEYIVDTILPIEKPNKNKVTVDMKIGGKNVEKTAKLAHDHFRCIYINKKRYCLTTVTFNSNLNFPVTKPLYSLPTNSFLCVFKYNSESCEYNKSIKREFVISPINSIEEMIYTSSGIDVLLLSSKENVKNNKNISLVSYNNHIIGFAVHDTVIPLYEFY